MFRKKKEKAISRINLKQDAFFVGKDTQKKRVVAEYDGRVSEKDGIIFLS